MFKQESLRGQAIGSILSYLRDESSKKKARLVCREWKYIAEKYFLKFHALLSDTTFPFIRDSTVRFDTLTVQDLSIDISAPEYNIPDFDYETGYDCEQHRSENNLHLTRFPNNFSGKHEEGEKSPWCPHSMMFRQGNSSATTPSVTETNMETILWKFRSVRSLIFDEYSLKFVRQLNVNSLVLENLVHLMISLRNRKADVIMETHEGGLGNIICQLSKIRMPMLTNLRLDSLLLSGDKENAMMYANIFDFVSSHSSSIRYFALRHCFRPYSNSTETVTELSLPWTRVKKESVRQDLSNISLKELTLFLDKYEGLGQFTLGLDVLASQYYLTKLEVHISDSVEPSHTSMIFFLVQRAVERNLGTLRHLVLTRNNISSPIADVQEILRAVYNYADLESLRLFVYTIPAFPHKLPPSLKTLELMGILHPSLLYEISNQLPELRHLQFANLTDEYLIHHQQTDMIANLKRVITTSKKLRCIKWHCPKLELSFLSGLRGISVKTSVCNAYTSCITL